MKYLKKYDEYKERFSDNIITSIRGLYKDTLDFSKGVLDAAKREGKETKQAILILRKMIRGVDISKSEKKFFKAQAINIAKLLPIIAIQGLPGGTVAMTPLLLSLEKRYNIGIFPKSNQYILDDNNSDK